MANFNFERNLPHQQAAVDAIIMALSGTVAKNASVLSNPMVDLDAHILNKNIISVQTDNHIDTADKKYRKKYSKILDICMETGTGKTYTYTKTIFELNKNFGLNKFIIVVPTLAIKAGTVNFLRSGGTKQHFKQDYNKEIKLYIVESKKGKKSKKKNDYMPSALSGFARANDINKNHIHVMIINSGMVNSPTLTEDFAFFGENKPPIDAIKDTRPITIIDEPHRFLQAGKTFENIRKFNSQYILRYGATFKEGYENLLYNLTAVEAFNQDLVKGIIAHVEEFKEGQNTTVSLTDTNGKEAKFTLNNNGKKSTFKIAKGENLGAIHSEMQGLTIESLNKSVVNLSNGISLKKNERINPYSYAVNLQDKMISQAINKHFEIEKELLNREVKIKPLSLFFIDDIAGYRAESHAIGGELKQKFEAMLKAKITDMLKEEDKGFYRDYLEKSLKDLSLTHGGYFSKDNTGADDKVEQEVEEILHDKEALLSLNNPRRFIFSKWTLREGWDNPNVFQICKLRSSGSETSKLQEVGRGLRIPVNEYMSRVTDENFDLHYYVDFTEKDFVAKLVNEINEKSGVVDDKLSVLNDELIGKILRQYPEQEDRHTLCGNLIQQNIINFGLEFTADGFAKIKEFFPRVFNIKSVNKGKVRKSGEHPNKIRIRPAQYQELQTLWEEINKKAILEYKIKNEDEFKALLKSYFLDAQEQFKPQGSYTVNQRLIATSEGMHARTEASVKQDILPIVTMGYKAFLVELAKQLSININTLHAVFLELLNEGQININHYMSLQTAQLIKNGFNNYLLDNAFSAFKLSYKQISNNIHPTAFTNENGKLIDVESSKLGTDYDNSQTAPETYLFEEIFYDSTLEKENIEQHIQEVIVFTKIPKTSIRIPVAGGKSYSPDFAYIVKNGSGKDQLNFIIETKNKQKRALYIDEKSKIKHAEEFFKTLQSKLDIKFKTQFEGQAITEVIKSMQL